MGEELGLEKGIPYCLTPEEMWLSQAKVVKTSKRGYYQVTIESPLT